MRGEEGRGERGRPGIDTFLERLRVEPVVVHGDSNDTHSTDNPGDAVFGAARGVHLTSGDGRVFGGQLAAHMLLAAQATVAPGKSVAAMHIDYLVVGDAAAPLRYHVERTTTDRTEVRRVVARQGHLVAVGSFTFRPPGDGFDHQHPMPAAAPVDTLEPHWRMDGRGFMVRTEDGHDPFDVAARDDGFRMWWRVEGPVPREPALHEAFLAYIGDFSLTAGPFRPIDGVAYDMLDRVRSATVNYSMWFHRPFRVDEWLLHDHRTPSAAGGQALTVSQWFTADGALVASCAQQTVSRLR